MNKMIILVFFIVHFCLFSENITAINITQGYSFELKNIILKNLVELSDTINDNKIIIQNPFRNIDMSWIKENQRLEKMLIAVGVAVSVIGVPILLSGILNYTVPFTDITDYSQTMFIVLMGVGGGLIGAGMPFFIIGAVRIGIHLKKNKKISLNLILTFK